LISTKKTINIFYKGISRTKYEVGIKPIDPFSFLHIIFGAFFTLFLLFIMKALIPEDSELKLMAVSGSLYLAILWEIIENFILTGVGLKFEKRKDSLQNSLTDIILTHIGGMVAIFGGLSAAFFILEYAIFFFVVWLIWLYFRT
jgi:hypothetical protein